MALFDWFSKKPAEASPMHTQPPSSGLMHDEATLPMQSGGFAAAGLTPQGHAVNRKTERLERRELLYAVVRDTMTHLGVLSAGYKFKVLSLDSRGNQFLIMMDLDGQYLNGVEQLAEFESLLAKNAKARHDIAVTSVYWRVMEQVTAGLTVHTPSVSLPTTVHPVAAQTPVSPAPVVPLASPSLTHPDPAIVDEFAAFKLARAAAAKNKPATESARSLPRDPVVQPDFQNTQIDDSNSPLSGTQYGELK